MAINLNNNNNKNNNKNNNSRSTLFLLLVAFVGSNIISNYGLLHRFDLQHVQSSLFFSSLPTTTTTVPTNKSSFLSNSTTTTTTTTTTTKKTTTRTRPTTEAVYRASKRSDNEDDDDDDDSPSRLKIGIISGFVPNKPKSKLSPKYLNQHIINQVCYADLWGYDYIFNSTFGFPQSLQKIDDPQAPHTIPTSNETLRAWWLQHGTWHRVPHMMAALPNYDWIVYVDNDYAFQSMNVSLEYFIHQWQHHGLHNVSIFIPSDFNGFHTFSAFAVMIRNSEFGWKLLQNWLEFGYGYCPKGNFASRRRAYMWGDSDQPGIWYALGKTYSDSIQHQTTIENKTFAYYSCNQTTGILPQEYGNFGGRFLDQYFKLLYPRLVLGFEPQDLKQMKSDQPIIWSKVQRNHKSLNGLGLQQTFGEWKQKDLHGNFGTHMKVPFRLPEMQQDLKYCINNRGCYAYYDRFDVLQVGCDRRRTVDGI